MARYIDADLVVEKLKKTITNGPTAFINNVLLGLIEKAPTAKVYPILPGEWRINCDGYYPYCSNCGTEPKNGVLSNFCPECGAYMKGAKNENYSR